MDIRQTVNLLADSFNVFFYFIFIFIFFILQLWNLSMCCLIKKGDMHVFNFKQHNTEQ